MAGRPYELESEVRVPVTWDNDLVTARREGRAAAERIGFSKCDATLVATAISELARNIVAYARRGEILISVARTANRRGIVVVARDEGPGIADTELALREGYSTSGGLGLGLPGVKRIMDEFRIESADGLGTTVTVAKWREP